MVATTGAVPGLLSNVATFTRDTTPTNLNEANIQPVYEVFANTQGGDLGSVSSDINRIVADEQKQLRPGNTIQVVGQIESMNTAFQNMSLGLVFAAIFVYLLMVVNYQTWSDPFVVILALPATLCGAVTMLFITGTTLTRSLPDGYDHGGRRRLGELHPAGHLCPRRATCWKTCARSRCGGRRHSNSARADDGDSDDRRHAPNGDRRAGRRTERRLGARVVGGLLFATPTTLLLVPYLFARLRKGADGAAAHGVFAEGLD